MVVRRVLVVRVREVIELLLCDVGEVGYGEIV
jgi:hypothetical protein